METQGLGQAGHLPGGAVIQDVDFHGLVGDAFDGLQGGPDDFEGFAGAGDEEVHGPLAVGAQALGPMAPQLPDIDGQQPEEQKGEALGRQEEEIGGIHGF